MLEKIITLLAALIAALEANTAAHTGKPASVKTSTGGAAAVTVTKANPPADKPTTPAEAPKKTEPAVGDDPAAEFDYEKEIRLPFLALLKVNRDKALALIPEGCKTMKDVKPAQYAAVAKAIKATAAELEGEA